MKIKHFKLKEGRPTLEDFEKYGFRNGGSWIQQDIKKYVSYLPESVRRGEISFNLGFKKNWKDFNEVDNIEVLDESFCQPYIPFYHHYHDDVTDFPFLESVIEEYNNWMSKFDFLEEVKDEVC